MSAGRSVPATMRAVVLTEFGEPEVLRITEVPLPVSTADEVLVRVHATALNRADLLQRRGFYPNPFPGAHDIPGMEFAGEVVAAPATSSAPAAARASRFKPGDHVMGIVSGGAYAEYVTIPAAQAMRTPRGMSLADAAAIPEVFITAWDALVLQGGLKPGGTALVHAGASGVGTAAIQVCRAMGARIIVTCSGARGGVDKMQACRDLGASLVIDYTTQDFAKEVADYTQGKGVDVVLDVIGGDYTVRNVACLALKGRIIQVGTMAGPSKDFNVASLMGKRASIIGTVLRPRPKEEKIAVSQAFAEALLPDFDAGVLKPIIDKRFTLDQIVAAHQHMEANANVGKIVVTVAA
mgnify:CR=1 FL=1